jgi:transposase
MHPKVIGLDLAKHIFQVHGVDAAGRTVLVKRLRRSDVLHFFARLEPCLIGVEACATAHYWARELSALGHEVRLMQASYIKPYVKRQKNDAADAEAICEAVSRPNMRFVPVKSPEQQSVLMLHRARDLLIRQRTMLGNAMRAHLAEFGIIARQGVVGLATLMAAVTEDQALPELARDAIGTLVEQLNSLTKQIKTVESQILAWHRSNQASRRLQTIPGVGPIVASALAATIVDPAFFVSGRHLAAWIGLVPRQRSSGGKDRLGRITKKGDPYLRRLLVVGASAVIRFARIDGSALGTWITALRSRRPGMIATVALANKLARIAWVVLTRGETYQARSIPA